MTTVDDLNKIGVRVGQLEAVDIHGILRGKLCAPDELIHGSAMMSALLSTGSNDEIVPTEFSQIQNGFEKAAIIPDPSTLTPLPWREGVASVIGDFYHV